MALSLGDMLFGLQEVVEFHIGVVHFPTSLEVVPAPRDQLRLRHPWAIAANCCPISGSRVCRAKRWHSSALARYSSDLVISASQQSWPTFVRKMTRFFWPPQPGSAGRCCRAPPSAGFLLS